MDTFNNIFDIQQQPLETAKSCLQRKANKVLVDISVRDVTRFMSPSMRYYKSYGSCKCSLSPFLFAVRETPLAVHMFYLLSCPPGLKSGLQLLQRSPDLPASALKAASWFLGGGGR